MPHLLQTMVHQLGQTVAREGLTKLTDAELLRRFTTDCDALAFEAIIWRHGTMVLDVCRRVLGRREDAEDAFQATFLSLIRHARSIRSGESLAGWLYRVARRLSVRMSRQRNHQTQRESQAARPEALILNEVECADWLKSLDREIERLPARYREAFILCHLEGRNHQDAARELGCPLGTLHSRLARAKERLRARLGLCTLAFPVVAAALVSPQLVNATVIAANEFTKGVFPAASAAVMLSKEGGNLMGFIHTKCLAVAILAVATIGSSAVLLNQPTASATSTPVASAPAEPTIEELKRENQRLRQEIVRLNKRLAGLERKQFAQYELLPTDQEVLQAMRKGETDRREWTEIEIVKNKILEQLGSPRFYPLVGVAQLRTERWECVVYYLESDAKNAEAKKTPRVQVVHIEKSILVTARDSPK